MAGSRRSSLASWVLPGSLLVMNACAAPPVEPPPPGPLALPAAIETANRLFAGSPLSGPTALGPEHLLDEPPEQVLQLRCTVLYLERTPDIDLAPLIDAVRLVADPTNSQVLRAPPRLLSQSGIAHGEAARTAWRELEGGAAGRTRLLADETSALFTGTTAVRGATCSEPYEDPDDYLGEMPPRPPVTKRVACAVEGVARQEGARVGRIGIEVWDLVRPLAREVAAVTDEDRIRPRRPLEPRRELLLLAEDLPPGSGPLVVVLRSPFREGDGRAFALRIELQEAPTEEPALQSHREAVQRARAEVEEEAAHAPTLTAAPEPTAPPEAMAAPVQATAMEHTFDRVLRNLDSDPSARATLVTLATASGATFTSDLALVVDDATLILLLRHIIAEREILLAAAPTLEHVGWSLERTSWRFVAAGTMKEVVAPEIEGVVLSHAGELARFPAMIEDAVLASGDLATFTQRLIDENRRFLEENKASARVRAFDWLGARGKAPAGFDPMAPAEQRQAALERAESRGE